MINSFRTSDKKKRFIFYKNEINILVLKYLLNNPLLKNNLNFNNQIMLNKSFFYFLKKTSLNKIVNYCIISGRSRGVLSKFKLTRATFRDYVSKGWLSGLIRSNW